MARSEVGLISDLSPDAKSLEGYLFPNTYQFTRTQSMKDMVGAMVKQFRLVAEQIGLKIDVPKTVTMASIIEKETAAARRASGCGQCLLQPARDGMLRCRLIPA